MDGTALMMYLTLFLVGAVCGLIWMILLIIGCVKKSNKRIVLSFIPLVVFAVIAGGIFAYDAVKRHGFEKIPCLEVENDTVTILSNTSAGAFGSKYVIAVEDENGRVSITNIEKSNAKHTDKLLINSDDSILSDIDHPSYMNHRNTKIGYKFKVNKSGTAYVCILIMENGHTSYLDIYKVIADDNNSVKAEKIERIERHDNFRNELPEKFSFLYEAFDELNK